MSKDNINKEKSLIEILKVILSIFVIAIFTYAIMAVITHFSLNFETETYNLSKSIKSIFDTSTAMFKFFFGFIILNIIWLFIAVSINYIKKLFIK